MSICSYTHALYSTCVTWQPLFQALGTAAGLRERRQVANIYTNPGMEETRTVEGAEMEEVRSLSWEEGMLQAQETAGAKMPGCGRNLDTISVKPKVAGEQGKMQVGESAGKEGPMSPGGAFLSHPESHWEVLRSLHLTWVKFFQNTKSI